jgi:hypothetical protein
MGRSMRDREIALRKNQGCARRQYRLWIGREILGTVQLLYRRMFEEDPENAPSGHYHVWVVKVMETGQNREVSVANLGDEITEMEVLAWATRK